MKIGINLICTGKYDVFVRPLITSIDKFFFKKSIINIYLFTDKNIEIEASNRINIIETKIEHRLFPYSTLMRYKYFCGISDKYKCDYLFYSDVDMLFVNDVGEEILPNPNDDCRLVSA